MLTTAPEKAKPASRRPASKKAVAEGVAHPKTPTALPDEAYLNILMNSLAQTQEHFGQVYLVREPGDEPAIIVLPKTLDVCLECHTLIKRGQPHTCKTEAKPEPPSA